MKRYRNEPDRNKIMDGYENQSFDKVWVLMRPYRSMLFGSMAALILFNMMGTATVAADVAAVTCSVTATKVLKDAARRKRERREKRYD